MHHAWRKGRRWEGVKEVSGVFGGLVLFEGTFLPLSKLMMMMMMGQGDGRRDQANGNKTGMPNEEMDCA